MQDGTMNFKVDDKLTTAASEALADPSAEATGMHAPQGTDSSLVIWLIAAGIILAGLVFRCMLLDAFFLDFDESMHFQAARESTLADAWTASQIHTHPPLIFLFYHFWMKLGDSELMLRLPALLFSISALVMGFLWLKQILGPRPALVGLAFLAFSMPMIHLGALMRSYTLLLTFIFAALYFQERFLRRHSNWALAGSGCCLALAMLTHYSSAWLMLVLGLLVALRVVAGTLPRRAVVGWVIVQISLFGVCAALYFGHVRHFVKSETQTAMWDFWLIDSAYNPETTHPLHLAFMRVVEFIKYLSGPWWILFTGMVLFGAIVLMRKGYRDSGSKWIALERGLIVLLPMAVAMLLFHFRIYPVGHTRHSMWLVPFVVAGLAGATLPLLRRTGAMRVTFVVLALSVWVYSYAYPNVWKLQTTQTPAMARKAVTVLKETVPAGGLILTDDSTRNVLEYYLVGNTAIHGRPIGGGYTEYEMAGYRVVTIPKFHFYMYNIKEDWANFQKAFGENATKPMWVAYLGFEVPANELKQIFSRFPPGRLIKRVTYLDNQILHAQFRPPGSKKTAALPAESDEPVEAIKPETL
tara:strand:+ start:3592 stop:5337 length:1746 start_codon:yes stop_codon:yes gene_type:complete